MRTLLSEGKLDRTIPSTPSEPEIFTDSIVNLTARRQRPLPRTPADQRLRWALQEKKIRAYGIEPEDWARMYEAQGGRCPGCRANLSLERKTHVDHCHTTGRVRGLLCYGCNTTLGGARDRPETLRNLAQYLERVGI